MSEWRILTGDVRARLQDVEAESVQCVVTSPPYWGLRDYGTAVWEGGDPECDHAAGFMRRDADRERPTAGDERGGSGSKAVRYFGSVCGKCGARRIDRQIGLEPSPEDYCAAMVETFRALRRVLRPDGTVWLNLGDSYANPDKGGYQPSRVKAEDSLQKGNLASDFYGAPNRNWEGLAPKNLVGVPWRVAFALQADGWYLRSDIIWAKPNPMPESVTDRPMKSHEYLFLLTKNERYFYDADAIREAHKQESLARYKYGLNVSAPADGYVNAGASNPSAIGHCERMADNINPLGRNKRSVWEIATQPYPEAHFATFPEKLIEPCILAGSRPGDLVLDPFCGSGTTGVVAIGHQRRPSPAKTRERPLVLSAGINTTASTG